MCRISFQPSFQTQIHSFVLKLKNTFLTSVKSMQCFVEYVNVTYYMVKIEEFCYFYLDY